jgi:Xaa-Pro dipeptidase
MTAVGRGLPGDLRHDVQERGQRLTAELDRQGIDVAVILEPENVRYLTGFETLGWFTATGALVYRDGAKAVFCREFEAPNAEETAPDADVITFDDETDPVDVLKRVLGAYEVVGWDYGRAAWSLNQLQRVLTSLRRPPADITNEVYSMRMMKSPVELRYMREAAAITLSTMGAIATAAADCKTEREVVAAGYAALVLEGSYYPSSPIYLVSGSRSALPHVTWNPSAALSRDVLYVEVGPSVMRYSAPLMWSGLGPKAGPRLQRLAEAVVEVRDTAIAAVVPGRPAGSVDVAARRCAEELGVADALQHRIGYSVGVSFPHGWGEPHVLALRSGERRELRPGMCFHLVPHLVDGTGAVGSGATVAVTETGCEILTIGDPAVFEF